MDLNPRKPVGAQATFFLQRRTPSGNSVKKLTSLEAWFPPQLVVVGPCLPPVHTDATDQRPRAWPACDLMEAAPAIAAAGVRGQLCAFPTVVIGFCFRCDRFHIDLNSLESDLKSNMI